MAMAAQRASAAMDRSCEMASRRCPSRVQAGRPVTSRGIVRGPPTVLPAGSTTIAASHPALTSTARMGLARTSSMLGAAVIAGVQEASRYQRALPASNVMS
jgi:hypothetical protein